jgi:cbb3-type cytochrome oxidase subunit 3
METSELKNNNDPKRRPVGLIYGLIAGACIVLFMTVLYKGGVNVYLGPFAWLGYIIMISIAVAATLAAKKANGGSLEMVQALKICFTVFVIVLATQTLFIWVLVNHIDTHFRELLIVEIDKRTESAYKYMGYDQQKIGEMMNQIRGSDHFPLRGMLTSLATMYIVFFLISLVIAAIVKKKKEEFSDANF